MEQKHRYFIAIGSNLNPESQIRQALTLLADKVAILKLSTFYQTTPIGLPSAPDFINGVMLIESTLSPEELKVEILAPIENALGRTHACGTRIIAMDLDLFSFDQPNTPCTKPWQEVLSRPYLVQSMLELDPELIMPDTGQPLAECIDIKQRSELKPYELELLRGKT
jgi:2-amino-4-hydroxy-6-hydroxymethyldihydropteridine diphosphokinase